MSKGFDGRRAVSAVQPSLPCFAVSGAPLCNGPIVGSAGLAPLPWCKKHFSALAGKDGTFCLCRWWGFMWWGFPWQPQCCSVGPPTPPSSAPASRLPAYSSWVLSSLQQPQGREKSMHFQIHTLPLKRHVLPEVPLNPLSTSRTGKHGFVHMPLAFVRRAPPYCSHWCGGFWELELSFSQPRCI